MARTIRPRTKEGVNVSNKNTLRDEIMLVIPSPGNSGPTRAEVITSVEWNTRKVGPQGVEGPKRKSIVDRLQRMIRDCEITEWTDGSITQNS